MGTPPPQAFAAVDLGATSGRVIRAEVSEQGATLREAHRFSNGPYFDGAALRWDIRSLWQEILVGLRRAAEEGPLHGIDRKSTRLHSSHEAVSYAVFGLKKQQ